MKETYIKAKARILAELHTFQWEVHTKDRNGRELKFPYAVKNGHRLDFKAQAVWLDGHSLFLDIRGVSCVAFANHIDDTLSTREKFV
jgi:hypothetical protein